MPVDLNLRGRSRVPLVLQAEGSECGLACLAMIAAYHGFKTDLPVLRRQFGISQQGTTLNGLIAIAEQLKLQARAIRVDMDALANLALPAVLHWNLNHFVVLTSIQNKLGQKSYHVLDPAKGELNLTTEDFSRHFTGVGLELAPSLDFRRADETAKLQISMLWRKTQGLWPALANVLWLSLIIQAVALALPYYLQLTIDGAYSAGDANFLHVLALGFLGLVTFSALTSWLRSQLILVTASSLSFQVVTSLFRHIVKLPLSWFEKRHVGDIVSRFGATRPLTELLTNGLVTSIIDGLMSCVALIILVSYAPLLAVVPSLALLCYFLVKRSLMHLIRAQNVDIIAAMARENTNFIETVRGAPTLKASGQEENRTRSWLNLKARAVNSEIKLGRTVGAVDAASEFLLGCERVAFVYVAVRMAITGDITLGMIFAAQAYKSHFLSGATSLVDQWINLRVARVHLERIADIVQSPVEPDIGDPHIDGDDISGAISLRNVGFRYAPTSPEIIKSVDLHIEAGELVAITGPSGGGKTTLMKIMAGLLDPTWGEIFVDEVPLAKLGKGQWRSHISCVLQDDVLFAGSIAENVAFFDPEIDMTRVRRAADKADILRDIEKLPMGFETLVGDMGSALSGGQRQRLLLARAIYPDPKVIFIDEGTSNLDLKAEDNIMRSIVSLKMTRILIAHRQSIIDTVPKVIIVNDGRLRIAGDARQSLAKVPILAKALKI